MPSRSRSLPGTRAGARALIAMLVGAAAAVVFGAAASGADSGAPTYRGCLSSDLDVGGCTALPGAVAAGGGTGLDGPSSIAVSGDGRSVYTASELGDAVATFNRDPATGALEYAGCATSNSEVDGCTQIPGAAASGAGTALDAPQAVRVSADGADVYVASSGGDAVARFARNAATGAIAFADCLTGDSTVNGCAETSAATAGGSGSGLDRPASITASADGANVYVASNRDDAVSVLERDPSTGELGFAGCQTSDSTVAGCAEIDVAAEFGDETALDALRSVAISADGISVYTAAELGDAVVRFDRDPDTGALAYEGCITSNTGVGDVGGCSEIAGAAELGEETALDTLSSIVVSPDGRSVYTAAFDGDAVARFQRDQATGAIEFADCITSAGNVSGCTQVPGAAPFGADTGLDGLAAIAVSADGERLYSAAFDGDAVARFDREPLTGELSFRDCTTSNADVDACAPIPGATGGGTNTGLDALRSVAVSANGESIYAASFDGDAVARFDRDAAEQAPNQFSFVKLTRNRRRGTARLTVRVPGAGRLILAGAGVRRASRMATGPGRVALPVLARGRAAKQLRRRGVVRVSARVTYEPQGGSPLTKSKPVRLIRRR